MAFGANDVKLHVRCRNNALNVTAENGLAFSLSSTLVFDTIGEDLVQAWIGEVETLYLSIMHSDWFIDSYAVTNLPAGEVLYELGRGSTFAGDLGGDALAPQLAGLISWRTGTTGRTGRGRTYLPPTSETQSQANGLVSGAHVGFIGDVADAIIGMASTLSITYAQYDLAIASLKDNEMHYVTSYVVRNKWATQRGRTR